MRWLCQVAYDGSFYSGFQIQPTKVTIQGVIEEALEHIHHRLIRITGAGRTDAGVHAYAQYFHFDSELSLTSDQWVKAFNANLPLTIRVIQAQVVHDKFHARFNAHHKRYDYHVTLGDVDPLRIRYTHFVGYTLDVQAMQIAAQEFVGTHDFHNFTANHLPQTVYERTITRFEVSITGDEILFTIEGNGFLHHMVRMIVGTLIEYGKGKITRDDIHYRLSTPEKATTPFNAPACGLYLMRIDYQEEITHDND